MQHTTETPKQYQCRHIFTDGHRCASPCLRNEEFCYYHHTTRKPIANPKQRRSRRATFHLPLPEDRSAIQASIGEVLQRIASNDIDPRRAGLLLYGLQIASLNLPKIQTLAKAAAEPQTVDEITIDPTLGVLAPHTEVSEITKRKSPVAQLLERMMQSEEKPAAPTPEPATIPTLQATADNRPSPVLLHTITKSTGGVIPTGISLSHPPRNAVIPTEAAHGLIVSSAVEGPPHLLLPLSVLLLHPTPNFHGTKRRHFDPERSRTGKRTCRRSGEIRFSTSVLPRR